MKNTIRIAGIIALVAVMGLALIGCNRSGGGGSSGGSSGGGRYTVENLSGTWVIENTGSLYFQLDEGKFEENNLSRGTYTVSGSTIRFTYTHGNSWDGWYLFDEEETVSGSIKNNTSFIFRGSTYNKQ